MRIGLFGDSFGYQTTNQPFKSWVDWLSQHAIIDNYCQSGVSEYKILEQLRLINLSQYDQIIITHTSPTRVFVRYNPLHKDSETHKNCDLLLSDIESKNDPFSQVCKNYFKYIFDIDYAIDIHNMICQEINNIVKNYKVIHITHFDYRQCYQFPNMIDFYKLWVKNQGEVNHYNEFGNRQIYETILPKLN
jgi:hypothetical protein